MAKTKTRTSTLELDSVEKTYITLHIADLASPKELRDQVMAQVSLQEVDGGIAVHMVVLTGKEQKALRDLFETLHERASERWAKDA